MGCVRRPCRHPRMGRRAPRRVPRPQAPQSLGSCALRRMYPCHGGSRTRHGSLSSPVVARSRRAEAPRREHCSGARCEDRACSATSPRVGGSCRHVERCRVPDTSSNRPPWEGDFEVVPSARLHDLRTEVRSSAPDSYPGGCRTCRPRGLPLGRRARPPSSRWWCPPAFALVCLRGLGFHRAIPSDRERTPGKSFERQRALAPRSRSGRFANIVSVTVSPIDIRRATVIPRRIGPFRPSSVQSTAQLLGTQTIRKSFCDNTFGPFFLDTIQSGIDMPIGILVPDARFSRARGSRTRDHRAMMQASQEPLP